jgi:iron complex transport system ATP-binding protein
VDAALDAVEARDLADRPISAISNGERARVLLARALAVEADVLLVDEAVATLDPAHQLHVMEVLRAEAAKGRLVIAVLHDLSLARRYCDELVMLKDGRLHASGAPAHVLTEDNIAAVYGITARLGDGDSPYVVPLSRV